MPKERQVVLSGRARREFRRLRKKDPQAAELIVVAIRQLEADACGNGAVKVKGSNNLWRVKASHHLRVVYEVADECVTVTFAGQREGAY